MSVRGKGGLITSAVIFSRRQMFPLVALALVYILFMPLKMPSSFGKAVAWQRLDQRQEFETSNAWWARNVSSIDCSPKKSVTVKVQPQITMFTYEEVEDTIVSGTIIRSIDDPTASGFFEADLRKLMLLVLKGHPGAVVLDIGANIGLHTVFFANEGFEVHAFEPYRATFELLACSVAANQFTKVHLNNFGLGAHSNTTCISESFGNRGHATVHEQAACPPAQTIKVHRLDKYLEAYNIQPFLIKIDIEGYEYFALQPVKEIFKLNPPTHIFSEFFPENMLNVNVDPKDYLNLLLEMGYVVEVVNGVNAGTIVDTVGSDEFNKVVTSGADIHAYLK
ncbi:S-adenosyl-L-methionine-dependent methyltransferase [Obelidium mucronatum]|nr:S-adenosyl-L-methionine-dependent methyltransferase [Obelidium mucronatum]